MFLGTDDTYPQDVAMAVAERFFKGLSPSGFHRLRYFEWGARDAEVVICVHGLTRNAHDFDRLADRLADRYRVVAVDVVGRGDSDWLTDPAHYTYAQYQADMNALLARLDVERVHWIGTSMGGLIGMFLAAVPGTPIASLLLNDVGPFIPKAALQRIADYLVDARFSSLQELERHLRTVLAPFGPLRDEDWAHLVRHGHRVLPGGSLAFAYIRHRREREEGDRRRQSVAVLGPRELSDLGAPRCRIRSLVS